MPSSGHMHGKRKNGWVRVMPLGVLLCLLSIYFHLCLSILQIRDTTTRAGIGSSDGRRRVTCTIETPVLCLQHIDTPSVLLRLLIARRTICTSSHLWGYASCRKTGVARAKTICAVRPLPPGCMTIVPIS